MPVDGSGLAVCRMVFGLIMAWEAWLMVDHGWVQRYFSGKEFYFTYFPFDFVRPLPADWMFLAVVLLAVLSIFVALGFQYRLSASCLAILLCYVFLLEKARYLNHFYLVCLIAVLMPFIPAHRSWSVDAWLNPVLRAMPAPAWGLWLIRFQLAVPMFFGGLAKLNWDWLRGEPLRIWLSRKEDFPILGPLFDDPWMVWTMVYGALLVDLLFVGYIFNRRTRVFGYGILLLFHLMNDVLWTIGFFPWLMIGATALFFPEDWPRRMLQDLRDIHPYRAPAVVLGALLGGFIGWTWAAHPDVMTVTATALGFAVFAYHLDEPFARGVGWTDRRFPGNGLLQFRWWTRGRALTAGLAGAWIAFQLLMPLRHYAVPGNVSWTEEGHLFAWHMMLRSKSDALVKFAIYDEAGAKVREFYPFEHLTLRQVHEMAESPEMIWQYARFVEEKARAEGLGDVGVHARVMIGLNGRDPEPLVMVETDLTSVRRPVWGHADWVLPMRGDLPVSAHKVAPNSPGVLE